MEECGLLRKGNDEDRFVITRAQARRLADYSYDLGKSGTTVKAITFRYVKKLDPADAWGAEEVARAEWLHIVTARHLRKARRTIRELRKRVERLQDRCYENDLLLDGYRGQIGKNTPFRSVPEHYEGDGFVTCDRAIESASSQRRIVERTPLQLWYWATALKYVWRMWSKEDPKGDALKAIDCIKNVADVGSLVMGGREDG